ncbi:hypothetical protein QB607_003170 [Clostridium botulinum]|nr:hypothetical protein [Clostridium botulinum]EKS4395843.1 hypothetical protein [Clostridium botulinum]
MEESIKSKYPNGLNFDECPYIQRFIYCGDIDILYYTGIEKELIEAIKSTEAFKKISNDLIDNGYEYEFKSHVDFSWSKPEWEIILIIK